MAKGIIVLNEIPKRCADCPVEIYEKIHMVTDIVLNVLLSIKVIQQM